MRSHAFRAQNRSIRRARRLATWRNPSAWRSVYARLVPSVRHRIVREPWARPAVALHLSAAAIQALWRGAAQRARANRAASRVLDTAATKKVSVRQGGGRGRGGGMGYFMRRRGLRGNIHARYDCLRGGRGSSEFEHKVDQDVMFRAWAASRAQAWWRMVATRWRYRYNHYTMYHIAASVIQHAYRNRLSYLRESVSWSCTLDERRCAGEGSRAPRAAVHERQRFDRFRDAPKPKRRRRVCYSASVAAVHEPIFQYYRDHQVSQCGRSTLILHSINQRASPFEGCWHRAALRLGEASRL